MTVYVDDMYRHPIGRLGRMRMSHLVADTREELFACVDAIGVRRRWIQHAGSWREHFDIAMVKRLAAIEWGAVAVSYRVSTIMRMRLREEGTLGAPDDAPAWFDAYGRKVRDRLIIERLNSPNHEGCLA